MRKLFIALLFPLFLGLNEANAQSGSLPLQEDPIKESLLKAAIEASLRLLVHFDFTAILVQVESDEAYSKKSIVRKSDEEDDEDDDARLSFPINLPPKAIMDFRTAGVFDFKLQWHLKSRGLGTVTGAHIHCKTILGRDGGIGVTLEPKGLFKDSWRKQHGTIKAPDEGNPCGWEDMLDVFVAMELNRTFVNIHTEENPEGEVSGDIENIGF